MGFYILKRIGQAVIVLIGISALTFALVHLVPGDPARAVLGGHATPAALAAMRQKLGLNRPLIEQYWQFLLGAVKLQFGTSTSQQVSVGSLVIPSLGATLLLALYASLVSMIIAIPLAILSAYRRNRLPDHVIRVATMVTFGMPPFWLGLILILFLSVDAGLFPTSGYGQGFIGHLDSLTLPALALGLGLAPVLLRTLRGSLIDALGSDYVEAARARGLPGRAVLGRYILRNSLVASMTVLGVNLGYLLGVVVVFENVFVLPGLGSLVVTAVQNRDFPVVEAAALVMGTIVVVANLITDVAYAFVDPRIRLNSVS